MIYESLDCGEPFAKHAPKEAPGFYDQIGCLMPLNENLIEVNVKRLVECGRCHTSAGISMNQSNVELICPSCYRTLGSWVTKSEAVADITDFVTKASKTSEGLPACKCVSLSKRNPFDPTPVMEHEPPVDSVIHYHILWSDSTLDWKRFATKEEATHLACQIKKLSESYTIVERDEECERCKAFESQARRVI